MPSVAQDGLEGGQWTHHHCRDPSSTTSRSKTSWYPTCWGIQHACAVAVALSRPHSLRESVCMDGQASIVVPAKNTCFLKRILEGLWWEVTTELHCSPVTDSMEASLALLRKLRGVYTDCQRYTTSQENPALHRCATPQTIPCKAQLSSHAKVPHLWRDKQGFARD